MDYETLLSLAESGDTKAMITIGGMYADFQGDKKNLDLEEAFKWFARSGEYGDVNGMKLAASMMNWFMMLGIMVRMAWGSTTSFMAMP